MRTPKTLVAISIISIICVGGWAFFQPPKNQPAASMHDPVFTVGVVPNTARVIPNLDFALSLYNATLYSQVETPVAVDEGLWVKNGELLAMIDGSSIRAAIDQGLSRLAENQAMLVVAKLSLKRKSLLLADGVLSRQVYEKQNALVAQLEEIVLGDHKSVEVARLQLSYTRIYSYVLDVSVLTHNAVPPHHLLKYKISSTQSWTF